LKTIPPRGFRRRVRFPLGYLESCRYFTRICGVHTHLYDFRIEENSIDTAGFAPLKYIPQRPVEIVVWRQDGSRLMQKIDAQEQDEYLQIVEALLDKARAGRLNRLLLRHP
jgi:hypothetical protein